MQWYDPRTWFKKRSQQKIFSANWHTWGGHALGSYDAFGGQPEPSKAQLVQAFNDVLFSATSLIRDMMRTARIRLYVKTEPGQNTPKCKTKAITWYDRRHVMKYKSLGYNTLLSEVLDHPALKLIQKGNPFHNGQELLALTQLYKDVAGDSYWLLEEDDFGLPSEVYLLPSQNVELVRDEREIVKGYMYHEGNEEKYYQWKDVIHFKDSDPNDLYGYGRSPARALWQRIMIGWKEASYLDNVLSNFARPDAILSPQNEISPFEAERLGKEWSHRYKGSGAGGIYVADGPMKLDTINWPPQDMAELQLYQNIKEAILNAYHIPIEMFSLGNANRATAEACLYSLAAHCIKPRLSGLVDVLNERLIPIFDDRLFFCADPIVPEDKEFDLQERQMLLAAGVITRGEARRLYDFPEEQWAYEPLIPSGMLPTPPEAQGDVLEPLPEVPTAPDPQQVSQQILTLQQAYYTGQLPREAVLAQAVLVLKLTQQEAEALFPEAPPRPQPEQVPPAKAITKAQGQVLDVPNVRQQSNYDCGAAATMAVCKYFQVGPDTEEEYIQALGTNEEDGTEAPRIVEYLEDVGLSCEAHDNLTVDQLANYVAQNRPVIVCLQDYGGIQEEEKDESGHWVVVCGVNGDEITLQDPSAGRVAITQSDFENNWHDVGSNAEKLVHYGIAVGKQTTKSHKRKALLRHIPEKSAEPFIEALKTFFQLQEASILDHHKAHTKAIPDKGWFDLDQWTREMAEVMLPMVELYYDHAANQTITRLGGDAELLKVVQPNLREAVAKATMLFCASTNESTSQELTTALDNLRNEIAEGLEVGDVKNAMMARVKGVFDRLNNERAYMIGHTEASRAQHNAMMITAKESGIAKAKRWILSSDACPQCQPLRDKTVPLDEAFIVDGVGPYAEVQSPPRHPLCRCTQALVVEGVNS